MAKGQFYFAWSDPTEAFAVMVHTREDEPVITFSVEQREGDFATLHIEIRNPRVGLLNPMRKQHMWLSWDNGTAIVPLFFGRLVGVPSLTGEAATIEFLGCPADFIRQKALLAATLRVAPYWDPVFVQPSKRGDPDAVLEARTALWHIDRVTGVVAISDILSGEDGPETFTTSEVPYDSLKVTMAQQPLISITVDGSVSWTQSSKSDPKLGIGRRYQISQRTITGSSIYGNWPKPGASFGHGWSCAQSNINTTFDAEKARLTSGSLKSPKPDFSDEDPFGISAGFDDMFGPEDQSFTECEMSWTNIFPKDGNPGGWLMIIQQTLTSMEVDKGSSVSDSGYYVAAETLNGYIKFAYEASRGRSEHVQFTLTADVQALQSPSNQLPVESIALGGAPVDAPIDDVYEFKYAGTLAAGDQLTLNLLLRNGVIVPITYTAQTGDTIATALTALAGLVNADDTLLIDNSGITASASGDLLTLMVAAGQVTVGVMQSSHITVTRQAVYEPVPIYDVQRASYFTTDAGLHSIEYLLMIARARLAIRARAVEIEVDVPFEHAVKLSCRKNGIVVDSRLPGGQATGKIVAYSFTANGDTGELIGKVTIGCCIGHGTSLTASDGTPDYVDTGYVDLGYQDYSNDLQLVGAGDVGYSRPVYVPDDDGIYFPLREPVFIDPPKYKVNVPAIGGNMSPEAAAAAAKAAHDTYGFTLKPLDTGPFDAAFLLDTSQLVLPKGIDLEHA